MFKTKDKKTLMDVSGLFDESRISAVKLHHVKVAHMPGKTCLQKLHLKKKHILITFKMCVGSFLFFVFNFRVNEKPVYIKQGNSCMSL